MWVSPDGFWTVTATSDDPADPSGPLGVKVVVEGSAIVRTRYWGVSEFRPRGTRCEWVGVPAHVGGIADEMLEEERDELEDVIRRILNQHDGRGKVLYDRIRGSAIGPCPRCGSVNVSVNPSMRRGRGGSLVEGPPYSVSCCDCGLRTSDYVDTSLMLTEWNEKHPWLENRSGRVEPICDEYTRMGASA